jgi:putative endonuclease
LIEAARKPARASKKLLGDRAERAAEEHLVREGYVVLERKLHVGRDEIDLLVQRGEVVAIVEVRLRGRTSFEGPLASVNAKKRSRLVRAAERLWRERFAKSPNPPRLRFDVVGVRLDETSSVPRVEHIAGAFVGD